MRLKEGVPAAKGKTSVSGEEERDFDLGRDISKTLVEGNAGEISASGREVAPGEKTTHC